jgi:hypothetical protein
MKFFLNKIINWLKWSVILILLLSLGTGVYFISQIQNYRGKAQVNNSCIAVGETKCSNNSLFECSSNLTWKQQEDCGVNEAVCQSDTNPGCFVACPKEGDRRCVTVGKTHSAVFVCSGGVWKKEKSCSPFNQGGSCKLDYINGARCIPDPLNLTSISPNKVITNSPVDFTTSILHTSGIDYIKRVYFGISDCNTILGNSYFSNFEKRFSNLFGAFFDIQENFGGVAKHSPSDSCDPNSQSYNSPIIDLAINDNTNSSNWSVQKYLQEGNTQYGDRSFSISSIPTNLVGRYWIRTANNSKYYTGSVLASFKANDNIDVYIAHDDRISIPSWLSETNGWTDTGDNLVNSEPQVFSIYTKSFNKGEIVSLGRNSESTSDQSTYTIVVTSRNSIWENFSGTSNININNYKNTTSLKSIDISSNGSEYETTITWTVNIAENFPLGNYHYYFMAQDSSGIWHTGTTDTNWPKSGFVEFTTTAGALPENSYACHWNKTLADGCSEVVENCNPECFPNCEIQDRNSCGGIHTCVCDTTVTPTSIPTSTSTPTPDVPGDGDGDGDVDLDDYVILLNNLNTSTTQGSSVGDFNGDNAVDGLDYIIWLTNFGG